MKEKDIQKHLVHSLKLIPSPKFPNMWEQPNGTIVDLEKLISHYRLVTNF